MQVDYPEVIVDRRRPVTDTDDDLS
jgi:tRNA pseudouridine38-40 synthase